MKSYPYHLVNVFADSHFGGNPLAVFPHADGLSDGQMQAIARQFNLSETVFVFPSSGDKAAADLRIFTPDYELPFAGHPTLGAAFVIQKLSGLMDQFTLNTISKPIKIQTKDAYVQLSLSGFNHRVSSARSDELAAMVQLDKHDIDACAYWLDCGSPQLFLRVLSKDSLFQAQIHKEKLQAICQKDQGRQMICLWFDDGKSVFVRFFFIQHGVILQDSGTGSACANLGAYFISQNQYPVTRTIYQGHDMGRPNRLMLQVDDDQNIYVGGRVIEVGKGDFYVPNVSN